MQPALAPQEPVLPAIPSLHALSESLRVTLLQVTGLPKTVESKLNAYIEENITSAAQDKVRAEIQAAINGVAAECKEGDTVSAEFFSENARQALDAAAPLPGEFQQFSVGQEKYGFAIARVEGQRQQASQIAQLIRAIKHLGMLAQTADVAGAAQLINGQAAKLGQFVNQIAKIQGQAVSLQKAIQEGKANPEQLQKMTQEISEGLGKLATMPGVPKNIVEQVKAIQQSPALADAKPAAPAASATAAAPKAAQLAQPAVKSEAPRMASAPMPPSVAKVIGNTPASINLNATQLRAAPANTQTAVNANATVAQRAGMAAVNATANQTQAAAATTQTVAQSAAAATAAAVASVAALAVADKAPLQSADVPFAATVTATAPAAAQPTVSVEATQAPVAQATTTVEAPRAVETVVQAQQTQPEAKAEAPQQTQPQAEAKTEARVEQRADQKAEAVSTVQQEVKTEAKAEPAQQQQAQVEVKTETRPEQPIERKVDAAQPQQNAVQQDVKVEAKAEPAQQETQPAETKVAEAKAEPKTLDAKIESTIAAVAATVRGEEPRQQQQAEVTTRNPASPPGGNNSDPISQEVTKLQDRILSALTDSKTGTSSALGALSNDAAALAKKTPVQMLFKKCGDGPCPCGVGGCGPGNTSTPVNAAGSTPRSGATSTAAMSAGLRPAPK